MKKHCFNFDIQDPEFTQLIKRHLQEPLAALELRQEELTGEWSRLYLNAFGRDSFFSSERVQRIFEDLTSLFLKCLKDSDFNRYFDELKKTGKLFFDLGVPFEEVVLCIHLFQEACLSVIQARAAGAETPLDHVRYALDELGRMGTAVFAVSFFRAVKEDWNRVLESYGEENEQ